MTPPPRTLPWEVPTLRAFPAQRVSGAGLMPQFPTSWALVSFSEHSVVHDTSHPGPSVGMELPDRMGTAQGVAVV